jgi:hypothetical protein
MPSTEDQYEADQPVWLCWSSGWKQGWIEGSEDLPYFHGSGTFTVYSVLQEDGKTFDRIPTRLLFERSTD